MLDQFSSRITFKKINKPKKNLDLINEQNKIITTLEDHCLKMNIVYSIMFSLL